MAELNFKLTEKNVLSILGTILNEGCFIVPDLKYKTSIYQSIKSAGDFFSVRSKTNSFLILNENWPTKLHMEQLSDEEYVILKKMSEPFIQLFITTQHESDEIFEKGFIGYNLKFWDFDNNAEYRCPEQLIQSYNKISKLIKAGASKSKIGKKIYWVSG